jgi:hypothetical protein
MVKGFVLVCVLRSDLDLFTLTNGNYIIFNSTLFKY